ncbi:hypothetical protein LSTR_LSTR015096 [Laodelphax striatellus]|uniref:Uncharacterized protein n=1 Tax=Laodelphax striatellus TaxID=195883 RepID=A0A482XGY4_LAOST|nr:hypothetical protein LSTR_LSTR015096 [Laodelphax striatellus]
MSHSASSNKQSRLPQGNENKPVSSAVQRTNELMEELQCRTRSKINKQTLDHRTRGEGSTGRESTPEPQMPARKTPSREKNKNKDRESEKVIYNTTMIFS